AHSRCRHQNTPKSDVSFTAATDQRYCGRRERMIDSARRVWKSFVTSNTDRGAGLMRSRQVRMSDASWTVESYAITHMLTCDSWPPAVRATNSDARSAKLCP